MPAKVERSHYRGLTRSYEPLTAFGPAYIARLEARLEELGLEAGLSVRLRANRAPAMREAVATLLERGTEPSDGRFFRVRISGGVVVRVCSRCAREHPTCKCETPST